MNTQDMTVIIQNNMNTEYTVVPAQVKRRRGLKRIPCSDLD